MERQINKMIRSGDNVAMYWGNCVTEVISDINEQTIWSQTNRFYITFTFQSYQMFTGAEINITSIKYTLFQVWWC